MISAFSINNFKSLAQPGSFRLGRFTCLIGMNGAGKSTLIQALDFISKIMTGEVGVWLQQRGWTGSDLTSRFHARRNIKFGLIVRLDNGVYAKWIGTFNPHKLGCTAENIEIKSTSGNWEPMLLVGGGEYSIADRVRSEKIKFDYQGSILSRLLDSELQSELLEFRAKVQQIHSLELLSPHLMRKRAREALDGIGVGGEQLSAFLHGMHDQERRQLIDLLKNFYPRLVNVKSSQFRSGWKRLSIVEGFDGKHIETEARHINDGLLRVLAILAQTQTGSSFLLFDEIENGINPEITEKLVDLLVNAQQQILVTTHSPMILNYLEDDVAKESVVFVYRTPQGETRFKRFFEIPRIAAKLEFMGPGEAFVDTDLQQLTESLVAADAVAASR